MGKEVSRYKKARNDMEEGQEVKKVRRIFTPEQKFEILKDIERCKQSKKDWRSISWLNRCTTSGSDSWK
jgi:hypothetical protein